MNPNEWLETKRTYNGQGGAAWAARELSQSASVISRMCAGLRYPSFQLMWGIYRLSNGEVSLSDWIAMFEEKARAGEALPPSRVPNPPIEAKGKRKGVKKWQREPKQTTRKKPATTRSKTRSLRR